MRHRHNQRKGTAAVEFALVAPLVFLLFFAAFEFARMSMIQDGLDLAACEGARRCIVPGATSQNGIDQANTVLNTLCIRGATITVTPTTITSSTPSVTVEIQASLDSNAWVTPFFFKGAVFDRAFTLNRELVIQ
ncbi:MAG: TadE/TadG family type IV pilus assembly protein [Thermoguttaceae bacterium]|jgi:Flp pilus assembly protein TadG